MLKQVDPTSFVKLASKLLEAITAISDLLNNIIELAKPFVH